MAERIKRLVSRIDLDDVAVLGGSAAIVVGVCLVSVPAGIIVGGVLAIALGIVGLRDDRSPD